VKLALHRFQSTQEKSGGLYYFNAVSQIARSLDPEIEVIWHDFFEILASDACAQQDFVRALGPQDMVVSNAGPYAAFYHYLRARHGGTFRILREVQTSSWSGYLLQESLCAPLQRPDDRVIFPSDFARQYFLRLFKDQLPVSQTLVGHPMQVDLPSTLPPRVEARERRIGYIGRISNDKNFREVLDAFVALYATDPKVTLSIAGPFDQSRQFPNWAKVVGYLNRLGVPGQQVQYMGALPHNRIWEFFARVDIFLFPAVASVETLGRVILEATHAGVPVVACHYAAAPELLPAQNLVDVHLAEGEWHDPAGAFSFGKPDMDGLLRALENPAYAETSVLSKPQFTTAWFKDLLSGVDVKDSLVALDASIADFLDRLEIIDLPRHDSASAMQVIGATMPQWARYNDQRLRTRLRRVLGAVVSPRTTRQELMMALARLVRPLERHAMGNTRELCRMANFRPRIRVKPQLKDRRDAKHAE
jgi:glycosyltransferase involved in cell wall biosynthesis